jgi:ACS family glucarate transporter-like MFS transporter
VHEPLKSARRKVTALLVLLFAVTYLDRVCIAVAGPRMQDELHIDAVGWGWVTGMFALAYTLFELPAGALGDRIGPRRVLTRIVLWWSAFTALTGTVTSYPALLVTRFMFGAGEAGAYPNAGVVVTRWYPPARRATLSGVCLMSSQLGATLAPLLVVPIQMRWGWRVSFQVFAGLGVLWAAAWYAWFRDSPAERGAHRAAQASQRAQAPAPAIPASDADHAPPLRHFLRSRNLLALFAVGFCYVYVFNFFQTWFQTFLVRGRGFTEQGLLYSALPYATAALANLLGGASSDALVARLGPRNGRRRIGSGALVIAAAFVLAAMLTRSPTWSIVLLSVALSAITFQQSAAFGACLDLGHQRAGALLGVFNMICQVGGLIGSVAYGYIVKGTGSYDAPFVPMAALLLIGAALWWRVDASAEIWQSPRP